MSIQPKPYYSFEDYLAAERQGIDANPKYRSVQVFVMARVVPFNHDLISTNLASELRQQHKSRSCIALSNAMYLPIHTGDACTYPGIMALCDNRPSKAGAWWS